ncbi:hypothetical protein [Sagittula stellata]|uniref:Uncharacterized protein n=1 Tax=Sagittula stellata (strain ATCC 700073 / DSM 11524 / E-37) TaxID=388399 RepID=A3K7J1_SAGS3|nr:hypothetical protein [Sagittula stellata]EBA06950.1 hypothetical protein SSE37_00725 [Sagittula stellata E-37]
MKLLATLTVLMTVIALALGHGSAAFGRVFMAAGLPGLAALTFDRPDWQGAALYRAGRMEDAARAFAKAGATYNLGTAQARLGRYSEALETYDLVIHGGDADARANFDLIAAYYAGLGIDPEALALFGKRRDGATTESFVARGNARAAGTGDEVNNTSTMLGTVQLQSTGQEKVRRIFDDRFMLADERWLSQLTDVPGDYLKARIAHERKRREKLGLAPPDPEDPQ